MTGDFKTSFWGISSRQNPHPRLKDKIAYLKNPATTAFRHFTTDFQLLILNGNFTYGLWK